MSVGYEGEDRKQGDRRPPVRDTSSAPGQAPGGQSNPANKVKEDDKDGSS